MSARLLPPLAPLATALGTALALAATAPAQTGPWTDGELVLRSQLLPAGTPAIFRVLPESGATAVLTTAQSFGGWAGSMVFDSYRGGLLANLSLAPDAASVSRLWLVSHDGSASALPSLVGELRAMASTGDGRVFFIRHTGASQGPQTLEYFDANDVIRTLKQSDGITPFQADVEHLLYHAPSNALIGSSSAQWAATSCSPGSSSLYRIPLAPNGLRVLAPASCIAVPTSLVFGDIMALDQLPDGKVLVTSATAFPGAPHRLLSLDPVTLAVAAWAEPTQQDINGGLWSTRLGRAVIHANSGSAWWEPDGLRTFQPGASGFGGVLATSLALPAGGGFSPVEILTEVDLNGPACGGLFASYGAGLAGKGGFVPQLYGASCPDLGQSFSLHVGGALGSTVGLMALGAGASEVPIFGGLLLVNPILTTLGFVTSGAPGQAGAGAAAKFFSTSASDPSLVGAAVWLQAGVLDSAAVQGFALTNGLKLVIG